MNNPSFSGWSTAHNNAGILLMLSSSFPCNGSGYAVRSHAIASNLVRHGVRLVPTTRPGFPFFTNQAFTSDGYESIIDDIRYHRLPIHPAGLPKAGAVYQKAASEIIKAAAIASNVSIIHAASDIETGLPAMTAAKNAGMKGIYEYRGMWHYTQAARNTWFPWTEPFRKRQTLELKCGHLADAVFAISNALKKELVFYGLPEEKITVLPNSVDTSRFQPIPADLEILEQYGLKGRLVIGFFGSFTYYEGLESLIDATLELNFRGLPVSLMLVGDGSLYSAHLKKHHEARGSHPAIIFTGRVPFEEINRYYSVVDIMAFPRIPAKVCDCVPPLKPLEAMAMQKAVVVSDVAALTEIIEDGNTGLVCKAGDTADLMRSLENLARNIGLRQKLASNGQKWVLSNRDWYKVSERILLVYEKLLDS